MRLPGGRRLYTASCGTRINDNREDTPHFIILKIFIREYHSKELKTNYKLMKILNEQYYQPGFPAFSLVQSLDQ